LLQAVADFAENEAKQEAPFRTGYLRNHITQAPDPQDSNAIYVGVGRCRYAWYVEFGSRVWEGKSYIRVAAHRARLFAKSVISAL
jgi:hypothetical protein